METTIELNRMRFFAYHGVMPQERVVGNVYYVDLKLTGDFYKATSSDHLEDTINYAEVYEVVKEEMTIPADLLEHVAGRILRNLFNQFRSLNSVWVRIEKQRPPIKGEIESSAFNFSAERGEILSL